MALTVTIDGVDRTRQIDWKSLRIQNVLTNRVDTCEFTILNYGTKTYSPNLGNEVIVSLDGTTVFGGVILTTDQSPESYKVMGTKINCIDYSRTMDGKLVVESYTSRSITYIITDIVSRYAPSGFTYTNVNGAFVIDYISFNYLTISKCLKQLAEQVNYDWYVDYDKDIHFFAKEDNPAPFDLNDNDGSYVFDSLSIKSDNSQVRNVVIVEGGEYVANTLTSVLEMNGTDYVINIGYKFNTLAATLSSTNLNLGIDFSSDPDDYDGLWNRDEKVIKFKETDIPSVGSLLTLVGDPFLPVIVKKKDNVSVQAMVSAEGGDGEYEYYINDPTINSQEGAKARATGELFAYASSVVDASFETEQDGLRSGQQIRINSTQRNIDQRYIINRVTMRMRTPSTFKYSVSLVSTRTFGLVEILQQLVAGRSRDQNLNKKKVLNRIEAADEHITITDSVSIGSQTEATETITFGESTTVQSIDYNVDFVAGPYVWGGEGSGDHKRLFLVTGSRLG